MQSGTSLPSPLQVEKSLQRIQNGQRNAMYTSQQSVENKVGGIPGWQALLTAVGFRLDPPASGLPAAVFFPTSDPGDRLQQCSSTIQSLLGESWLTAWAGQWVAAVPAGSQVGRSEGLLRSAEESQTQTPPDLGERSAPDLVFPSDGNISSAPSWGDVRSCWANSSCYYNIYSAALDLTELCG